MQLRRWARLPIVEVLHRCKRRSTFAKTPFQIFLQSSLPSFMSDNPFIATSHFDMVVFRPSHGTCWRPGQEPSLRHPCCGQKTFISGLHTCQINAGNRRLVAA